VKAVMILKSERDALPEARNGRKEE